MADQRIKGQEVSIIVSGPNGQEETLSDAVRSVEFTVQMEILTEAYLGETSNRKDDVFNGISGRAELHMQRAAYFGFVDRVKSRATRRSPAQDQFDLLGVFVFPNGDRARLIVENVFWGEIPINVGAKNEYITTTVNFEAEDFRTLVS